MPDAFKDAYARQFPKKDQQAAREWIEQIDQDARRNQAAMFDYTTQTRRNKGKTETRHGIPEGGVRVNPDNQIFIQYRDLTAMNYNIDKLIRENRVGNKTKQQILDETLADLKC